MVPVGERVLARAGRGPSMGRWDQGEVEGHQGPIHRVSTSYGVYWCEADDLLPDSPRRQELLVKGTPVWALWLDGRWYPGTVSGIEGPLRQISFDDGDRMWMEARSLAVMVIQSSAPHLGQSVIAPRWNGQYEAATVELAEGERYRVLFQDGDEAWFGVEDLKSLPPCPFHDQTG